MVRGNKRSRTLRRVYVKTPSKTVIHYRKRKPAKPQCGSCGEVLKGVARGLKAQVHKLSKTQRRPERPYGGVLCTRCMRRYFTEKARKYTQFSSEKTGVIRNQNTIESDE
ncbi:MAG TPA: 50S ribosomal protein L34e [Candidatus Nanoarchaeia archaeon]|nr:50S ribosomal protein L34e [Candidatus Nanoarchaeia archaeon]